MRFRAQILPVSLVIMLVMALRASAEDRCGDAADRALFQADSWERLAGWASRYPQCDDGYFAEHVSELVGRWLAERPSTLPALMKVIDQQPVFEAVVLRHIDITLSEKTTGAIRRNAERHCPEDATTLCRHLIAALKELDVEARERRAKD